MVDDQERQKAVSKPASQTPTFNLRTSFVIATIACCVVPIVDGCENLTDRNPFATSSVALMLESALQKRAKDLGQPIDQMVSNVAQEDSHLDDRELLVHVLHTPGVVYYEFSQQRLVDRDEDGHHEFLAPLQSGTFALLGDTIVVYPNGENSPVSVDEHQRLMIKRESEMPSRTIIALSIAMAALLLELVCRKRHDIAVVVALVMGLISMLYVITRPAQ